MLTVAEALQLEEFRGAQVVAGAQGLSRQVGWVHVAGVPDAPNWLNGGELVLTTMINLPAEADEQRQYRTDRSPPCANIGTQGMRQQSKRKPNYGTLKQ